MREETNPSEGGGGDIEAPHAAAAAEAEKLLQGLRARVSEAHAALAKLTEISANASHRAAEVAAVAESAAAAKASIAEASSKAEEAAETASAAAAAKTAINDAQAVIATKSAHIQDAQEHADKVRAELDRIQTVATKQATGAEGLKDRAQAAADDVTELLTSTRAQKALVDNELAAAVAARDEAKTASATTKGLADKAESIEQKIADYEARLVELEKQSKAQLNTITSLLPGATAAGLASAFDKRRNTFIQPSNRWQLIFVASLIALIALAFSGLWQVHLDGNLTWDELARLWVARLPIAAALVWLALYASRESALAKRLEEDYGYKAAIASSFQGFQKQMAEIEGGAERESPLGKLCTDTLSTIGNPPGRIYDKHELTTTPLHELANAITELAKAAKGQQGNPPNA